MLTIGKPSEGKGTLFGVWDGPMLTQEWLVGEQVHGGVYADFWFGATVAWDAEEKRVVYVAEVRGTWGGQAVHGCICSVRCVSCARYTLHICYTYT